MLPRMVMASTGWVYISGGRPGRMLRWQLLWSPTVGAAYAIGLPWGAVGVATAFAIVCWLGLLPAIAYCFRGTDFTRRDVLEPVGWPLLCTLIAWAGASGASWLLASSQAGATSQLAVYVVVFLVLYGLAAVRTVPLVRQAAGRMRFGWRRNGLSTSSVLEE